MDIKDMRQILAIRAHGSFGRAAVALGMSQPSLSTAVARLEDELRVKLFARSATGSTITPIGEAIAERAARVVWEAEQIVSDAQLVAGGDSGTVRIGIGNAHTRSLLPSLLSQIAASKPALRIHIEVGDRDRLIDQVKTRALDMAFCALPNPDVLDSSAFAELTKDLVYKVTFTSKLLAVANPAHPLAEERGITPARFAAFPSAGTANRRGTNIDLLGVDRQHNELTHYVANDFQALLPLVLEGLATLIAPRFVVRPFLEAGSLVALDIDVGLEARFAAITSPAAASSPIVQQIINRAVEVGRAL
jgi:DNA-binding transcriptional LysR family regulator